MNAQNLQTLIDHLYALGDQPIGHCSIQRMCALGHAYVLATGLQPGLHASSRHCYKTALMWLGISDAACIWSINDASYHPSTIHNYRYKTCAEVASALHKAFAEEFEGERSQGEQHA